MAIFNSYVKLPEGRSRESASLGHFPSLHQYDPQEIQHFFPHENNSETTAPKVLVFQNLFPTI